MNVEVLLGNISSFKADVIVTAANSLLRGGGGVDGAIHLAAGPLLMKELQKFEGCETGDAVLTNAYNLNAKHIIHAVGPIYEDGTKGESILLSSAYKRSIELAHSVNASSIIFPLISTGVYGYPLEEAIGIALNSTKEAVKTFNFNGNISFVCYDKLTQDTLKNTLNSMV